MDTTPESSSGASEPAAASNFQADSRILSPEMRRVLDLYLKELEDARRIGRPQTTFEEALLKRLEELSVQLAPLRELAPPLPKLDPKLEAELATIRAGLQRPDWSNATRLDPRGPLQCNPFAGAPKAAGVSQSS